jgi:hypothetical protein
VNKTVKGLLFIVLATAAVVFSQCQTAGAG